MRCIENLLLWLVDYSVRFVCYVIAYHLNLIKMVKRGTPLSSENYPSCIEIKVKKAFKKSTSAMLDLLYNGMGIRARVCVSPLSSYLYIISCGAAGENCCIHNVVDIGKVYLAIASHFVKNTSVSSLSFLWIFGYHFGSLSESFWRRYPL